MTRGGRLAACALAAAVVLAAGPAGAFQVQWQAEPAPGGAARLAGYVHNDNLRSTANLRVRADRLGPEGAVTGTYRAWVPGVLAGGDRAYFEVPVPERGGPYRVSVESFDWFRCGE